MKLKGIGASSGIAIAKVFELKEAEIKIDETQINDVKNEFIKIDDAIKETIKNIEKVKIQAVKNLGSEEAAIFDAHIQVAADPSLIEEIKKEITDNKFNAAKAAKIVTDRFAQMFESMDDSYMKERAADVKDVAKRMINILLGIKSTDVSTINEEVIIVADDLTPSDTALLDKKYVKGFVTNIGGKTSHAAIMARSLEIPAVLGLKDITNKVKNQDVLAMDGENGEVLINPSAADINAFKNKAELFKKEQEENKKFIGKQSISKDGHHVEIAGNIGSPSDVAGLNENDAEGVGLFRSEFLYMDASDWPSEEDQFNSYKSVLSNVKGRVVVRTLDIGGDKTLDYYKFPKEMNPFLGYRAIRLCLDQQDVFKTQLRALLKASIYGKLAIMFPMIATVEEFIHAKQILEECKQELKNEKIKVAQDIEVGMMVEIPAAAVLAEQFAKHADFFSIGTNDLMQYTMAADRMSEKVSYLYQPLNPSILNMINMTIKGAHKYNKWVGMCGEMAGDKNAIPLLLGMGLDEFSMSATSVLATRKQIFNINFKEAQTLAQKALSLNTEKEVKKLVDEFNKN